MKPPIISLLPKGISELIAAGEVIERPASVVKEILENAIDSGSSSITVEIRNGGSTYIRVTDNGCGIPSGDLPLAFMRHATSKIHSKEDLESILTLGFRGEALASIAAVSRIEIVSRVEGEMYGNRYLIEGGVGSETEVAGAPEGTTITVRDLFFNVPARQKFLKKDVTEGNAVAGLVEKLAVSHPEISFTFIRDRRTDLHTAGDGKLYTAIHSVLGRDFAASLLAVDYEHNGIIVKGYTVKPIHARPNRSFQHFYINQRYIKSVTCITALEDAYQNLLMTGKFPACVINIGLPPNLVDVNVHPAKIEVRFSNEKLILEAVYFAIRNALLLDDQAAPIILPEHEPPPAEWLEPPPAPKKSYAHQQTALPWEKDFIEKLPESDIRTPKKSGGDGELVPPPLFAPIETENEALTETLAAEMAFDFEEQVPKTENLAETPEKSAFKLINPEALKKAEVKVQAEERSEAEPEIRMIGEVFATYILAEAEGRLILVDKHAAHERFLFKNLKAELESKEALDCQLLFESEIILLSHEEAGALEENLEMVKNLGFDMSIEGCKVAVKGVPTWFETFTNMDLGRDLRLDRLVAELSKSCLLGKEHPQSEFLDELLHSMACKAAIKAKEKHHPLELETLLKTIYGDEEIKFCPHGRPVMMALSQKDLEKYFKRIV